jgi:DNA replication and repair protein RecF
LCLNFDIDRIAIIGANGRGKSNILEAISYLSIGKSTRGAKDIQAIPHKGHYFDIEGFCNDGHRDRNLRIYYAEKDGKKVFCDGAPLPRVSEILGIFRTVHFSPEDVSLVMRFPTQRRRLLDILISQSSGQYLNVLQRYQRVLSQRNRYLRTSPKALASLDQEVLRAWDSQLADLGGRIRWVRLNALELINEPFKKHYALFSCQQEEAELRYTGPKLPREDHIPTQEAFAEELAIELLAKRQQALQQGHTPCGPHRDHLIFDIDNKPADLYASEGQLKTALISWKMAEAAYLEQQTGIRPVLLLDDIFSELDSKRVDELWKVIEDSGQVILTTPVESGDQLKGQCQEIRLDG